MNGSKQSKLFERLMMYMFIRLITKHSIVFIISIIMFIMAINARNTERMGDQLQIALPLMGLACAGFEGRALQYTGRYLLLETFIKGSKFGLGDARINTRPTGSDKGFPSGHTAVATFGAVGLVQTCMKYSRVGKGLVLLAAGTTGGSRVEADAHYLWQVIFGVLLGWGIQVISLSWVRYFFSRAAKILRGKKI